MNGEGPEQIRVSMKPESVPTKENLAKLLDVEIAQALNAQTRAGWTPWILIVAIGGILSKAATSWGPSTKIQAAVIALIAANLAYSAMKLLSALLPETARTKEIRFEPPEELRARTRFIVVLASLEVLNFIGFIVFGPALDRTSFRAGVILLGLRTVTSLVSNEAWHLPPSWSRTQIGSYPSLS